jgi:hypothetical protein
MKAQQFSESPLVSNRPACRPLIRRQSQSVDYYLQPTRANRAVSKFVLCLGLLHASRRIAARMVEPRGFEPLTPTMPWWGECLSLKVRSGMIRFSALYSARRFLLWSWLRVLRPQPGLARIAGTISTPSPANKARPAQRGAVAWGRARESEADYVSPVVASIYCSPYSAALQIAPAARLREFCMYDSCARRIARDVSGNVGVMSEHQTKSAI